MVERKTGDVRLGGALLLAGLGAAVLAGVAADRAVGHFAARGCDAAVHAVCIRREAEAVLVGRIVTQALKAEQALGRLVRAGKAARLPRTRGLRINGGQERRRARQTRLRRSAGGALIGQRRAEQHGSAERAGRVVRHDVRLLELHVVRLVHVHAVVVLLVVVMVMAGLSSREHGRSQQGDGGKASLHYGRFVGLSSWGSSAKGGMNERIQAVEWMDLACGALPLFITQIRTQCMKQVYKTPEMV